MALTSGYEDVDTATLPGAAPVLSRHRHGHHSHCWTPHISVRRDDGSQTLSPSALIRETAPWESTEWRCS